MSNPPFATTHFAFIILLLWWRHWWTMSSVRFSWRLWSLVVAAVAVVDSEKQNFSGPGYLLCPLTSSGNDQDDILKEIEITAMTTTKVIDDDIKLCDSMEIDPSCSTISTCDFDQDNLTPFLLSHNNNIHQHEFIVVPLICECMVVFGCPPSCQHLTPTEYRKVMSPQQTLT